MIRIYIAGNLMIRIYIAGNISMMILDDNFVYPNPDLT